MTRLEQLNSEILIAPHPDMEPHVTRGAFILVDPSLDLAMVAHLMERNEAVAIQDFLARKLIRKVEPKEAENWRLTKTFFRFLIIQPFVVGQVLSEVVN